MDKKGVRKAALWLLFRGGIDEGCCSGLDYVQGPEITLVKHMNKLFDLRIFRLFFRVKEKIRRQVQSANQVVENIIAWLFPFVLDSIDVSFGNIRHFS